MSTLREIAEAAGVSVSTASMAVRDHQSISLETKKRVWKAQEKLGYRTHLKPRPVSNLDARTKNERITVAYLLIDREFDDPAYSMSFQGVSQRVTQRDWRCVYLQASLADIQKGIVPSTLRNGEIDGLIVGGLYDELGHTQLSQLGIPLVVMGNYRLGEVPWSACEIDVAQGMHLLIRRLEAFGHKRFGLIVRDQSTVYERSLHQHYLQEMMENGRQDAGVALICEHTSLRDTVADLLEPSRRPDALILASATFGDEVYEVCAELGIRLPDDLSVATFGRGTHILKPALASVRVEPVDLGARCLEKLASLIEDPRATPTRECFPMRFLPSGSIAAPKNS